MYLSRLVLNPKSRAVRRDLADCWQLHRTLMRAFPAAPARGDARAHFGVLYRSDVNPATGNVTVYVQSRERPDWARLDPDYLLEPPACKSVEEQYGGLREGMVLRFRLRANPTRKVDTKTGPDGRRRHGKRVELRNEADQIAWLKRKAEQGGFELLSVRVSPAVPDVRTVPEGKIVRTAGQQRLRASGEAEGVRTLTFASVLFDGNLRIVDAARFRRALAAGIGPGKAYGFGLLSLAPPGR